MNSKAKAKVAAKSYAKGMGQAVADRTINRIIPFKSGNTDNSKQSALEKWSDVALRVSLGNTLLHPEDRESEFEKMHYHLSKATLLMSGRHLQHGDETQPHRPMEVFTNCATSAMSFLSFYLLLNGSGVGRAMDDELMLVDYRKLPIVVPVISHDHQDVVLGHISGFDDLNTALGTYQKRTIHQFSVPDTREGWAKAIEKMEVMAFEKKYHQDLLILDFSLVRPRGSPIKGMQNRPAAGPGPLMMAIEKIARLREAGMEPWRSAMFADHYLAECVLVGGARRAARMATKSWRDLSILEFISIKRDGVLWSSNNSVTVDAEFWNYVKNPAIETSLAKHARKVFLSITKAAYNDGTGEPGIINQDKLSHNESGLENYLDGEFAKSNRFQFGEETLKLTRQLASISYHMQYHQITNPCGEITLNLLGGYCVIADVVPYHAANDDEACEAFATATKALMRVNLMDSVYKKEVLRTNRIGVGITGIHEWAWERFGFGWKDIVDENKSKEMWLLLSRFKRVVKKTAAEYAMDLGKVIPHTDTTIKPAGTTSKLFGLTEGAHLPSMREYIRWVQFRSDDPVILEYQKKGYPTKELKSYSGTTVVGFPTRPLICTLGMGEKLVTAAEATPLDQYQYLKLLEKYWIRGVDEDGITPLPESGNQVSYTLKYDPKKVSYHEFVETLIEGQSAIRCCSVMPQTDTSAYEYQPEESVSASRFAQMESEILKNTPADEDLKEDVDVDQINCDSGVCS